MSYISLQEKIQFSDSFTFDDVLLLPNYTDFTRDDVDLSVQLHPKIKLHLPVISSPMDTVTMSVMAINLAKNGGLGIIHRNLSIEEQALEVERVKSEKGHKGVSAIDKKGRLLVGAAVGIGSDLADRAKALIDVDVDLLLVDSAHGHSKAIIEAVKFLKKTYPELPIMAGNITTFEGSEDLIAAGADILRVGMGPGSICTTRIVTGMGVPQLTAVNEVARSCKARKVTLVADGGIKQIGDISKAIAFGADSVMLGSMLAGFDQSPGDTIEIDGNSYKTYRGMGSVAAMKAGSSARYGQGPDPKKMVAEGVEGLVKYKGSVEDFLNQISGGIKSSLFYCGGKTISEFYAKTRFIRISGAGLKESHPHDIHLVDGGRSYL
jgi:IMP dehydrogenase